MEKEEQAGLSIEDQIEESLANNKDFLALTHGTRMWWDENGEATLVVFGSIDYFGDENIMSERVDLDNSAAIGRFSGSVVERQALQEKGALKFVDRDGKVTKVNSSKLKSFIEERSKVVDVSGSSTVYEWEGFHPLSEKPMLVKVMGWSVGAKEATSDAKRLMRKIISPTPAQQPTKLKVKKGSFRGGKGAKGTF